MVDQKVGTNEAVDALDETQFVEVMFARNDEEAAACCSLLGENQIAARQSRTGVADDDRGVAILVPETNQDEALELLALRAQDDDGDEDEFEDGDDEFDDDDDDDDDFDDDVDDDEDDDLADDEDE